jgi:hypothetical protein
MTDGHPTGPLAPRVRDRDVVILAALVVAAVVIFAWVTGLVPALDEIVGLGPAVIVSLVLITAVVLIRALVARR